MPSRKCYREDHTCNADSLSAEATTIMDYCGPTVLVIADSV